MVDLDIQFWVYPIGIHFWVDFSVQNVAPNCLKKQSNGYEYEYIESREYNRGVDVS